MYKYAFPTTADRWRSNERFQLNMGAKSTRSQGLHCSNYVPVCLQDQFQNEKHIYTVLKQILLVKIDLICIVISMLVLIVSILYWCVLSYQSQRQHFEQNYFQNQEFHFEVL